MKIKKHRDRLKIPTFTENEKKQVLKLLITIKKTGKTSFFLREIESVLISAGALSRNNNKIIINKKIVKKILDTKYKDDYYWNFYDEETSNNFRMITPNV